MVGFAEQAASWSPFQDLNQWHFIKNQNAEHVTILEKNEIGPDHCPVNRHLSFIMLCNTFIKCITKLLPSWISNVAS